MPSNVYHFVTRWRVKGLCGEVADVLGDPLGLPRWWPSVYLTVEQLRPPDARGVGRHVRLHTKGWLPYTLRWEFVVVENRYPYGFTIEATGDFIGRGVWTIQQDGDAVNVTYDWRIRADKPLLRNGSLFFKPLFEANHRWAMARGHESLLLELARRRVTSSADRDAVPPPPGPVTYSVLLLVGAVAAGAALAYLVLRAVRRSRQ